MSRPVKIALLAALFALGIALVVFQPAKLLLARFHSGEDAPQPLAVQERVVGFASFQGSRNADTREGVTIAVEGAEADARELAYGLFPPGSEKGKVLVESKSALSGVVFGIRIPPQIFAPNLLFCVQLIGDSEKLRVCLAKDGILEFTGGETHRFPWSEFGFGRNYSLGFQLDEAGANLEFLSEEGLPLKFPVGVAFQPKKIEIEFSGPVSLHNLYVLKAPVSAANYQFIRGAIQSSHQILTPNEAGKVLTLIAVLLATWIFGNPEKAVRRMIRVSAVIAFLYFGIFLLPLFADGSFLLRDNYAFHLGGFAQIGEYLRQTGDFPQWFFTREGGVWTSVLSNNLLLTSPHRILSYVLASASPVSLNLIYKASLLAGVFWFFLSLWWLIREAVPYFRARLLLYSVYFLFSGLFVAVWHQEQVLGTLFWLPLLGLLALRLNRRFETRGMILFASVLGLSLNLHYPQIIFIVAVCAASAAIPWTGPKFAVGLEFLGKRTVYIGFAVGVLLLAAAPLLYVYVKYADQLASAFRLQNEVEATGLGAYVKMHKLLKSSVDPLNFLVYLIPDLSSWRWTEGIFSFFPSARLSYLDDNVLKIPQVVFPLILTVLIFAKDFFAKNRFLFILIALLLFTAMGIKGPLIWAYWFVIPGIGIFRQWYHFLPIVGMLFAILFFRAAVVWLTFNERRISNAQAALVIALAFILGGPWSAAAFALALLPLTGVKLEEWAKVLLLVLVVFAGNRTWMIHQSQQMTTYRAPVYLRSENLQITDYLNELLFHPNGYMNQILVKIKDAPQAVRSANGAEFVPQLAEDGFQIDIPKDRVPFTFSQYDDGRWITEPPIERRTAGALVFENPGTYKIARQKDAWLWLVGLSYFTALVALILYLLGQPVRGDH